MADSLADRLAAARRQNFVGRTAERELLRELLAAPELPVLVVYFYGPGGVGKSSLLQEAVYLAGQFDIPAHRLDGRQLEAAPANLLGALRQSLGIGADESPFPVLAGGGRQLILIDTAELLSALDFWLQEEFLPQLPANILVLIASRHAPAPRWRGDSGWQQLMRVIQLKNLAAEESRAFLARRQIPARQHEAILQFTHGHPLALSLVADRFAQQPELDFRPELAPDMIKSLLDQFLLEVPTAEHRAALEACAQVRLLTEPLLGALLPASPLQPLFAWLRTLSFVESDRRGLFLHDLARTAIDADLRWRDSARLAELQERATAYYLRQFQAGAARHEQFISDYLYLQRDNPLFQSFFDWQLSGLVFVEPLQPADQAPLVALVRQYEGAEAADIATRWLGQQPQAVAVVRQPGGTLAGFWLALELNSEMLADTVFDPAIVALAPLLAGEAALAPAERLTYFRFWLATASYQAVSPLQSRFFLQIVQHFLTSTNLAFTALACADPDYWAEMLAFAGLGRLDAADFTQGDRRFGLFGRDWRQQPPLLWLASLSGAIEPPPPLTPAAPLLAKEDFFSAVQAALRHFTDELALQGNPLLNLPLVTVAGADSAARMARLKALLQEASATLATQPRRASWAQTLQHTYFQPAVNQEQAAERLDLPFSTYRRHLRAASQYVCEWLWARYNRGG